MEKDTTAARLKEIMEQRNLKQVDILNAAKPFCEKYGIKLGRNDLSQYVSGKVSPGQWKLTILGLALNVSEAWLMGYDVPMKRPDLLDDNKEEAAPETGDSLSPLDARLMDQLRYLTTDQKKMLLAQIETLLRSQE